VNVGTCASQSECQGPVRRLDIYYDVLLLTSSLKIENALKQPIVIASINRPPHFQILKHWISPTRRTRAYVGSQGQPLHSTHVRQHSQNEMAVSTFEAMYLKKLHGSCLGFLNGSVAHTRSWSLAAETTPASKAIQRNDRRRVIVELKCPILQDSDPNKGQERFSPMPE
jgi:hypothetical protein